METNPVPNPQPTPQYAPPSAPPKNNRALIIVVVAVVLLCCCCVTAIGGYYGYKGYVAAKQAKEDFQNFKMPDGTPFIPSMPGGPSDPDNPNNPDNPDTQNYNFDEFAPKGGRADDVTRITAWTIVQFGGLLSGCTAPTVDGTTISVTQEPDSSGVWREDWNVNCGDNTTKMFHLKFTPQDDGMTNVEIE
ncbi:MAG: hypothetical protein LC099_00305 [Anaerolineales bacterium]|nr:hypothetical protein [Anaerolineales bacterium]